MTPRATARVDVAALAPTNARSVHRAGGWALACAVAWLAACGGAQPTGSAAPQARPPLLMLAPPQAHAIVHLSPAQMLQHAGARALWEAFVDAERERAFAERTGIEPRSLRDVLFIEYTAQKSYALIVRGPFDATAAVRRAAERLVRLDVSTNAPRVRREGLGARGRWAYVALAPDTLLVAYDVPPAELGALLERDARSEVVLPKEAASLASEHAHEALVLLMPQPLALPGSGGTAILLARERAMAVVLRPEQAYFVASVDLRGEFPNGAEENFRTLLHSLSSTELGAALGFGTGLDSLRIQSDADGVRLSMRLDGRVLVRGLRMLFFEELSGLFR